MSQISENRRKRKIRRIVSFSLSAVLILTAAIWWFTREDPPPMVKVGNLQYGDITSTMMVSAQIQPGSVEEIKLDQYQRVLNVHVKTGDQVEKGDLLLTLDQSELKEQYNQAVVAREQIEDSIAQSEAAAKAQEEALRAQEAALQEQAQLAQQAQEELNRQAAALASSLSRTTAGLVQLSSIQPAVVEINPELNEKLTQELAGFDPEDPQAQDQLIAAIALLEANIDYSDNPAYIAQISQLENELQQLSDTTASLIAALGASSTGINAGTSTDLTAQLTDQLAGQLSSELAGQLGGIGGLGNSLETALVQAIAYEEAAELSLAESISELKAPSAGMIAQINIMPGDYTGSNSLAPDSAALATGGMPAGLDLSSVLGSSAALDGLGGATGAQPALLLYDNTKPKAVFQASQFDSKRIEVGMPVTFDYDGQKFGGRVSYIAPYATGSQFSSTYNGMSSASSTFPAELSGIGGLGDISGEPSLLVEMTIAGTDLEHLIPGFKIDASIQTEAAEDVLILPAEAMRREIDNWYIFVVDEDNIISLQEFTAGIQAEMSVEVIEGLSIDDKVVLNPSNQLTDGMSVEIDISEATD